MGFIKQIVRAVTERGGTEGSPPPVAAPEESRGNPCPRCGAPAGRRVETSGFGSRRPVVCGQCGQALGVVRL